MVLPSRKQTRIVGIDTFDGELATARAPMAVSLRLAEEIDISRGDMLVHPNDLPQVTRGFDAMMVWLSERPLDTEKSYLLKHTTQLVRAQVQSVAFTVDLENLGELPATTMGLNDIGKVRIEARRGLYVDPYTKNRGTGSFILIDSLSNNTVAAGMILPGVDGSATGAERGGSQVSAGERRERLGQIGACVVLQGNAVLASDVAFALERVLFDTGHLSVVRDLNEDGLNVSQASQVIRAGVHAGLIEIVIANNGAELKTQLATAVDSKQLLVIDLTSGDAKGGDNTDLQLRVEGDAAERAAAQVCDLLQTRGLFVNS
jgi:bifunctional enzyme CysN/CysC/sulfate adenylyltransferase subunit 1